jgi:hypothetical protein
MRFECGFAKFRLAANQEKRACQRSCVRHRHPEASQQEAGTRVRDNFVDAQAVFERDAQ